MPDVAVIEAEKPRLAPGLVATKRKPGLGGLRVLSGEVDVVHGRSDLLSLPQLLGTDSPCGELMGRDDMRSNIVAAFSGQSIEDPAGVSDAVDREDVVGVFGSSPGNDVVRPPTDLEACKHLSGGASVGADTSLGFAPVVATEELGFCWTEFELIHG